MIRLKVFISSVQKELREERSTLGGLLATADQAQIGRKDLVPGANRAKSNKPSSAVTRKQQSKRKKR